MISAKVTTSWNPNIVDEVTREAMQNLARQGQQRLTSITCPVHGSSHSVAWEMRGKSINVTAANACCDELQKALEAAAARAIN